MSTKERYEWRNQQARVNESLKGFLNNPGKEQLDLVVALLQAYASAAKAGQIEIPQQWISVS